MSDIQRGSEIQRISGFRRRSDGQAVFAGQPLRDLLEQSRIPTPTYFYDLDGIREETEALVRALGPQNGIAAYALKANSAGTIVKTIASAGAGADVVSGAELELALASGVLPSKIVMSGVAKTDDELDRAIQSEILGIQAESVEELSRIAARATALGKCAPVALRMNPGVSIDSHTHIATGHDEAKFGIQKGDVPAARAVLHAAGNALRLTGISTHVGSMLRSTRTYLESARVVCGVWKSLTADGLTPTYINFGGGFGIDYGDAPAEPPTAFAAAALGLLADERLGHLRLVVEPGRSLVGPFGVLVARVIQTKKSNGKRWLLLDAGMNDLLRPALYGAHHRVESLDEPPGNVPWRVVGPVCESADDFGVHALGEQAPEWVVLRDTGAYGFSMASEYNGRALPSEIFVRDGRIVGVSRSAGSADWVRRRLDA